VIEMRFYFEISVRVCRNTWRHIPEKSYVITTTGVAVAKHRQTVVIKDMSGRKSECIELAFIKALSTFQHSPAVLKELRMALPRRKKKPLVPARSRSTMPAGGARVPQHSSSQLAGKRKI
jgi:hypothetical protein